MARKSGLTRLEKNKYLLFSLCDAKNPQLRRAILQHSNNDVIKLVHECLHNVLVGNVTLTSKQLSLLKRNKTKLRSLHDHCRKEKCLKRKREFLIEQSGNNPVLFTALRYAAQAVLPELLKAGYDYVSDKIKKIKLDE